MTNLATLDYVMLAVYLLGTMALGVYIGRRLKTGSDLFLAGRSLPWWAIGMSLVATDIGGTDIIGVGGQAYRYGMAVSNFEWIGCIPAMIIAAFVFVPFFWRTGVYTIPELMERRFNVGARTLLSFCWVVFMACNLGIMLLASAKLMSVLLGWDQSMAIWVTAIMVGVYTIFGGLAAVVYTDVIQCAVMIGGCLIVLVIGLAEVGGPAGLRASLEKLEQERVAASSAEDPGGTEKDSISQDDKYLSLVLPVDTKTPFPWTGILFGLALILSPAYWIGNQAIVQRSLGAKSDYQAKAAYVMGALLKNIIPIIVAVPGLIALIKFPELRDGDHAFPTLVAQLLPSGLRGVFLASFLAALMSSIDSYLNSSASLLTNDFYKRFARPDATDRQLLLIGRIVTTILLVWAIYFAFLIIHMQSGIYAIFQTLMAFFQGPALAMLMSGLLWKRATGTGAIVGFLAGICTSVTLYTLNQPAVYQAMGWEPLFQIEEPFLYFSVWAFLVALVLIIVVSLLTKREPAEKIRYCVFGEIKKETV